MKYININKNGMVFKFIKLFFVIIIVPVTLNFIIINSYYTNLFLNNTSKNIDSLLEQISFNIQNETIHMSFQISTVAFDDDILNLVINWKNESDTNLKSDYSKQINSKLNYLLNYADAVESVIFFFKDYGYYSYKAKPIVDENTIRSYDWYLSCISDDIGKKTIFGSSKNFTYYSNTYNLPNSYIFFTTHKPGNDIYKDDIELVYFAYRTYVFDNLYSKIKTDKTGNIIVLDSNHKIMISQDRELLGKDFSQVSYLKNIFINNDASYIEKINDQKYFISKKYIEKNDWTIIDIQDYNKLTQNISKIYKLVNFTLFILFILFILFSVMFFKNIIKPINKLQKKMQIFQNGNFNANISIKGDDEIWNLANSFNNMTLKIKKLIEEINIKEKEKSKAEIAVLQSQINPHFLSNTLNSIRLMAIMSKTENIANMTDALIKLLSASINKHGKYCTVQEEIDYLKSYVYIMKFRYGDTFDIIYNIDSSILNYYVLKLILQPMVENSILHGINGLNSQGVITINGYKNEDKLLFEIIDNGVGIPQNQIDKIFSENNRKSFNNIGISNVEMRIKLNYGNEYGIKIQSELSKYTKASILLPIISNAMEE